MTTDDPFFGDENSDRTVLKPTPGGRRSPAPKQGATPRPAPPSGPPRGAPPPRASGANVVRVVTPGMNPLVDSAGSLLALATQLRSSMTHADPAGLNQHIAAEIKIFEDTARERGCKPEAVLAGRYALCTFIDEVVLSTPWGANSQWSQRTLLSTFHREGWGGEKFFAILDRVGQDPVNNINLIELLYVILLLGFEGKYRVEDRGKQEVNAIQDRLYQLIRTQRGDVNQEMSPHWRGVKDLRNPLQRFVPLWAVAVGAAALLLATYMGFSLKLSGETAPVIEELQSIGRERAALTNRQVSEGRRLTLKQFLAPEIEQKLVDVDDRPGRSVITLRGTGLFAPGSARVNDDRQALLTRVAEALNTDSGRVAVVGHTDNIPISGGLRLKFPSNFDLSQARADGIMQMLQKSGVAAERMGAEGRGEVEPLVDNDTAANRALNRRVELTLTTRGR